MKRLTKKELEKKTTELFNQYASGVQFDIFDLSKVSQAIESALKAGHDGIEATKQAVQTYRKN